MTHLIRYFFALLILSIAPIVSTASTSMVGVPLSPLTDPVVNNAGKQFSGVDPEKDEKRNTAQIQAKRRRKQLPGTCVIDANPSNPMGGPCTNFVLTLLDPEGHEVARERTLADGSFEFTILETKKYTVAISSRYYEVVNPSVSEVINKPIEIHLKQK
jgi:hypothetical protein